MNKHSNLNRATIFLNKHQGIRKKVKHSKEFQDEKNRMPSVVIDGIFFFFPEGDIQKEEDDIILDFAIRRGLVSPKDLE